MYQRPLRPDELAHFGIKGMHWGIRRWQNEDGSLTPAGRRHYGRIEKRVGKLEAKNQKYQKKYNKNKSKLDKYQKRIDRYMDKYNTEVSNRSYKKYESAKDKYDRYNDKADTLNKLALMEGNISKKHRMQDKAAKNKTSAEKYTSTLNKHKKAHDKHAINAKKYLDLAEKERLNSLKFKQRVEEFDRRISKNQTIIDAMNTKMSALKVDHNKARQLVSDNMNKKFAKEDARFIDQIGYLPVEGKYGLYEDWYEIKKLNKKSK